MVDKQRSLQLFSFLRLAMGEDVPLTDERVIDEAEWMSLVPMAKKHDIAVLLAVGLEKSGVQASSAFVEEELMQAMLRYERAHYVLQTLCEALEAAQIAFIPLKGAVLRALYPEPWMRTSCDIDILVKRETLEDACRLLLARGYRKDHEGAHDIALMSPEGVAVELHFDLVEDDRANAAREVLGEVWDTAIPKDGYRYWQEMRADMRYFYHIAHMAKHIVIGGCGIRPFIDLWLLDRQGVDCAALLARGGLERFAAVVRGLSRGWMTGTQPDEAAQKLEQFILRGGVYGNSANRVALQQQKAGSRLRYALGRVFLPYGIIKELYPVLKTYPALTPFYEVVRWCVLLCGGRARSSMRELAYTRDMVGDKAAQAADLLNTLGL